MDDEFKLCWKNFQDNIASGFQNLYDRGDLVDVTLACDGKLLQAHKIVLAICSPYFQEIFISNPCKHPIIILKDVSYNIMCELLEFMYQGVVNVKHTELQAFMKVGQLLQIKGLATNSSPSAASLSSEKSSTNIVEKSIKEESPLTAKSLTTPENESSNNGENPNIDCEKPLECSSNRNTPNRPQSPVLSPSSSPINSSINTSTTDQANKSSESHLLLQQPPSTHGSNSVSGTKRHFDYSSDSLSIYSRNKHRRSVASTDHSSENADGGDCVSVSGTMDQMNTDDFFLPHISMVESRYELNNIKRETQNLEHHQNTSAAAVAAASASLRNSFNSAAFGLDYSFYKNNSASLQTGQEYPNDLHMSNDYTKSFANHMDIPPNCPNMVMLSSTSLLHGNCVFNRNNTVATQQGMKTYWLCKSYRITMCRARCITHQGKIISATGVHNHPPHMRGSGSSIGGNSGNCGASNNNSGSTSSPNNGNTSDTGLAPSTSSPAALGLRIPQSSGPSVSMHQQNYYEHHHLVTSPPQAPPPSSALMSNPHMHSSNTSNASTAPPPPSHLFSMPNLLVQHYPSSQSTHIVQQPSFPPQHHHNALHNYEMTLAMQTSSSNEHSKNLSSSYDPNEKSLGILSKETISNEHMPTLQNVAAHSPSGLHNNNMKADHVESLTHENKIEAKMSSSDHHQVQVIDSITIQSPNSGHNFKMESM